MSGSARALEVPRQAWCYGLPGLPLALVALPLYVHLPHHYAGLGASLASLGAILLLARVFDAATDPLLGRWIDRLFSRGSPTVLWHARWLGLALMVSVAALWFPPRGVAFGPWALLCLVPVTLAYSALVIAHQSWGARLGGDGAQQSRIVAWREGWALAGVLLAAVLPGVLGWPVTLAAWATAMALAGWAWARGPHPNPAATPTVATTTLWRPWRQASFRRLLAIFVASGLASAMPATLVLFFIDDRLQTPHWQAAYLGSYFLAAAAGLPAWLALARRIGLAQAWLTGMVLAVVVFVWAATLQAGQTHAFVLICLLSGLALGADLALPAALLAGVIADAGDRSQHEGAYFGWWNVAAKANLALAAGVALPALQALGYSPGTRNPEGLLALTLAYAVLPCVLKLVAATLLWRWIVSHPGMLTSASIARGSGVADAHGTCPPPVYGGGSAPAVADDHPPVPRRSL